jgi:hypothetical protein
MKTLLFLLLAFVAVTSILSGLFMISKPDGSILYLPLTLLHGTPFKNFLVPGILLTVVVGGVSLVAVFLSIDRHPARYNWSMASGIVTCVWILLQMLMISSLHWLHFAYLIAGGLISLASYQLKGKWVV